MKVQIPIREIKTYQSADGIKIEEHRKIFIAEMEVESEDEIKEMNLEDDIYFGLLDIMTPVGAQMAKFPLEGSKDLQEAINSYPQACSEFIKNLENHSNIIKASEHDLNMLEHSQSDSNSSKIIF